MSDPAEKCPPAPVRMSTSIPGSASIAAMMSGSASHISRESALRLAGRDRTRVPTPPETVRSKPSTSA